MQRGACRHDRTINKLELDIDEQCMVLIDEEQPVTRDLRLIINAMLTGHTQGRIADHGTHICEGAIFVETGEYADLNL